jgi:hypothetical protein
MKNKFIPFYFPQLYSIPENDEWWGKGYTDWNRVKIAEPHNSEHYQPRIPLNKNYYDQGDEKTQLWQVELALKFNIYGFNFYHYWFDGKLLLEKPIHNFKNLNHDLKYCITWANESWTKRWEGKLNEVLIQQNHHTNQLEWESHFNYLLPFFQDERYITIEDKPVFCIYRPDIVKSIDQFVDFFQNLAHKNGLKGIYFIALRAYEPKDKSIYKHFDAIMRFQPRDVFGQRNTNSIKNKIEVYFRALPERIQIIVSAMLLKFQSGALNNYQDFWDKLISMAENDCNSSQTIYQSIAVDWDNTARYKNKSHFFTNCTPDSFKINLIKLLNVFYKLNKKENLIFVNAWNEWSEGAYLEPDEKFQYSNLETLKELSNYDGDR